MSDSFSGRNPSGLQGFSARKERWLQAILADEALPRNAHRVAAAIAGFLNSKTGQCWPSVATLAKLARFAGRTIQRLLRALEGAGYLTVHRGAGAFGCNIFAMVAAEPPVDQQATPHTSPADHPHVEISAVNDRAWIALDSPEWAGATQRYRAEHGKAPPVDKRGGWWFARRMLALG